MLLVDLVAVALATGGLVDAWKNGSLFVGTRAYLQARQEDADPESWMYLLWELLLCSFCLSYHVAFWLFVLITLGDVIPWGDLIRSGSHSKLGPLIAWTASIPFGSFIRAAVFGVAAARFSFLINGLLPERLRYDRNPLLEIPHVTGPAPAEPTPVEESLDPGEGGADSSQPPDL